MTYSYFPPSCLLQINAALLRVVPLHDHLPDVLLGGPARAFASDWHLYCKINIFRSGFIPFPFKNLQVIIFLLALLFWRRWRFPAVGAAERCRCQRSTGGLGRRGLPAVPGGRARAGGPGEPGSAVDLRHALSELFNVFMLKCAFSLSERTLCILQGYCEM